MKPLSRRFELCFTHILHGHFDSVSSTWLIVHALPFMSRIAVIYLFIYPFSLICLCWNPFNGDAVVKFLFLPLFQSMSSLCGRWLEARSKTLNLSALLFVSYCSLAGLSKAVFLRLGFLTLHSVIPPISPR